MNETFKDLKKGEKLFVVDLETVSLFPDKNLYDIVQNEIKYQKTPFLYLIASYVRNKSLFWANEHLTYKGRVNKGSWMVYCFEK